VRKRPVGLFGGGRFDFQVSQMSEQVQGPVEVTGADFDEVVLRAPPEVTVVVDFWAPWCAPCRVLSPVLEKVVGSLGGRAMLVKANVEADPQLAARFGIQSIPEVILFRGGELAGSFTGAAGEARVRSEIESVAGSPAGDLFREGEALVERGRPDEAEVKFRAALEADGGHGKARLLLARVLLQQERPDEAEELLKGVDKAADEYPMAQALLGETALGAACRASGGIESCRQRLSEDPEDLEALYGLACCLAVRGDYRQALEKLLKVVEIDKNFRDSAARNAMVAVFSMVGQRSPLSDEFRSKLAGLLY